MEGYFGTDGIRGIANEFLTGELASRAGNAVAQLRERPLILVGRDTRISWDMLALAFSSGAIAAGATVFDLGVIPTAGVAYCTRLLNADFGVVISASHNPPAFNGIKLFDRRGFKLSEETERLIEHNMNAPFLAENARIGKYVQKYQFADLYVSDLAARGVPLEGMKVVLDCANGGAYKVAPTVFRRLGAAVTAINTGKSGFDINENAGALHPEVLAEAVREEKADVGFAYDGDADRLIAADERGEIVDGDRILYLLACDYREKGRLDNQLVIGTSHTNMGVQVALKALGIELMRSDVGDKYVIEMMEKTGAVLGGEQSGHIILGDIATTGDGILTSVRIAALLKEKREPFSALSSVALFPQANLNVRVRDKLRVLNDESLAGILAEEREALAGDGRIIIRASGTEPVIRILVETASRGQSDAVARRIARAVEELEK